MRLSTKVAYNTLVQAISKTASTALGLLAIAFITRYLGQVGFGQYTTIITYLAFFGIVADLGLTLVTAQMISQPGADENKILSNLLGLRLVTAVFFLGLAPLVILFFPYQPIIKLGVLVTTLSFLFIALNQVLVGLFQKKLRMDKVSIAEVVGRITLVVGVLFVVSQDYGLIGIMVATVLASAVNFLLHYIFSRSFAKIKLGFNFSLWKKIIIKSWPLALTIVFNLIYLKTDTLLLSLIKRPTQIGIIAEVGIYGAAYRVVDVLITLPFMFAGIVLPILTALWAKQEKDKFSNTLQKSFNVLALLAIPLAIGTQFVANDVMTLVAGREFILSGAVLKLLIIAASLIYLGNIFSHAVIAIDKQKQIIGAYIFTAITAVAGYFIFIPRFSYFGAAWVTIYSELIIALAAVYIVWKYTHFLPSLAILFKSLAASLVMILPLYYLKNYNLIFVVLPSAVATYLLALYAFGGIAKNELKELFIK